MLTTVLRIVAMTCGAEPVRIVARSSSKTTSRTQCRRFSIPQCPRIHAVTWIGSTTAIGNDADHIDDLDALAVRSGDGATHLHHLCGVREAYSGCDFGGLDRAAFTASVATPGCRGRDGNLVPRQGFQSCPQRRLVVLHGEHVVPAAADDVLGGATLAVQGIGGDNDVGEVERGEQIRQCGNLVGLRRDLELPNHDPGPVIESCQQVCQMPGGTAGAAESFAVDSDHPASVDHAGTQPHPRAQHVIEDACVDPAESASDRRLRRGSPVHTEPSQCRGGRVVGPFGDRGERSCPGARRGQCQPQDRREPVSHPAPGTRIGYLGEDVEDPGVGRWRGHERRWTCGHGSFLVVVIV